MNTTDHWDDLKAAGQVPPPSEEVLAHARHQLDQAARRRSVRRVVVPTVAAVATAAAVVGAVAVYRTVADPNPIAVSPSQPGHTVPTGTSRPKTGIPSRPVAASCVAMYSPAELRKRTFAFDGTVVKIVEQPDRPGPGSVYLLTLQVHEWFKPAEGAGTVTALTFNPPEGSGHQVSVDFPDYAVGSRLLITGEPRWGGPNPLQDAVAWGCGFSRAYSAADAGAWRKVLSK